MISYLQIENFKSLRSVALTPERMNLFLGMNGMGKSSVIQSLLLLRQSYWQNQKIHLQNLFLNGPLIRLGMRRDVFCQTRDSQYLRFVVSSDKDNMLDLRYPYDSEEEEPGEDILTREEGSGKDEIFTDTLLQGNSFSYLSAEHIGPRSYYSSENFRLKGINPMGTRGDYVVPYLAKYGTVFTVSEVMHHPAANSHKLLDEVSAWLGAISPGIQVMVQDLPYEQSARLSVRYSGSRLTSDEIAPENTGFGVSYVLPLITELLMSNKDSLLLIENPESHLHPRGQSEIAKLMSLAASAGAQIICETHSDHIVNGTRVSVHDRSLDPEDLYIAYFDKNENQETVITDIQVDNNGNLSSYPDGLLDEWGILMSKLF